MKFSIVELLIYLIIGIISLLLSILGSITSGTGIILYPVLLFFGYPPHIAIATFRFGLFGIFLGALTKFRKQNKIVWEFVIPIIFIGILATIIGTNIFISINEETLGKISGVIILILIPFMFLNKQVGIVHKKLSQKEKKRAHLLLFIQKFIANVFPPGAGIFGNYIMMKFYKLTALQAKATSKIPQIISNVIGVIILASVSLIDYKLGLTLLISNFFGAYIGTHISIKKGDNWMKNFIMVFMIFFGIYLIFFF